MAIDLPPGFDNAPATVQYELLKSYSSEELVSAIRDELDHDGRSSPQLNKSDKASILLRIRQYHEAIDNDEFVEG